MSNKLFGPIGFLFGIKAHLPCTVEEEKGTMSFE